MCSAAAAAAGASAAAVGPAVAAGGSQSFRYGAGAIVGLGGGGAAVVLSQSGDKEDAGREQAKDAKQAAAELSEEALPWLAQLLKRPGVTEMLAPGQMLRRHPIAKLMVEQDHLFEAMLQTGQIRSLRCFYDPAAKEFHSVVSLGRDVCGYPQTVHGGLTAAISDETFGGLGVCLWRSGALGFRPPAYTARLEVDYKRKIPAGNVLVTTTRVEKLEGRKLWMTATVSDGKGRTYATARALFVAPRMQQVLLGWLPRQQ